jgi:isocitrate lyase
LLAFIAALLRPVSFSTVIEELGFISASTAELASQFKEDGMLAYVKLVQQKEKEIGCDVLTHQKW